MVVDKVIGHRSENGGENVIEIPFEWFELEKKRITKVAADGTKIGIALEDTLRDGDVLAREGEKEYVVRVAPTRLICIPVTTMEQMGRLGFEFGNRHLSLQIREHEVCVPFDEPTFQYLNKLGFDAQERMGDFTDYIVCKAHGHSHEGEHTHGHAHHHTHSL